MNPKDELRRCPQLIRRWARKWHASALAGNITCEWSSWLRRSLSRTYPERSLVRLSKLLKESPYEPPFDEVLCHKVAYVTVFHLHGKAATSHGPSEHDLSEKCRLNNSLKHGAKVEHVHQWAGHQDIRTTQEYVKTHEHDAETAERYNEIRPSGLA